jgi:hypothetical protein
VHPSFSVVPTVSTNQAVLESMQMESAGYNSNQYMYLHNAIMDRKENSAPCFARILLKQQQPIGISFSRLNYNNLCGVKNIGRIICLIGHINRWTKI